MPSYSHNRTNRFDRPKFSHRSRRPSRQPKKAYIDPAQFVRAARPAQEEHYDAQHKFTDFNVHPLIQANLSKMGFVSPSPIQDQAIPLGLQGYDIVGVANTGTGKTAAFAIPLLNRLLSDPTAKAVLLAPTRELAQQIREQLQALSQGSRLQSTLLIGGVSMGPQLRELKARPRIIIGTPGRVKDHLERKTLTLSDCTIVVLDEVDRMLDMGFVHDIRHIIGKTAAQKQSFYFSATLDARVRAIIEDFSHDPQYISVKSGETSENVEQNVITFSASSDKIDKLHDLLIHEATVKTIIFDDTHRSVEKLSKELEARGFSAGSIHGGKSQSQRQRIYKQFKDNEITILVATDVAARGLDVSDITHVVNYSTPSSYEDYVHRIGRTGRAGKTGYALTFIEG